MKLDASALRYLSDDEFRVLTGVELGMRNHELVPVTLICSISGLKHGGCARSLKQIHKHKLVHREARRYVGYRLTSLGYDFLALRALSLRGVLSGVGGPIGVGKEADVVVASPSCQLCEELASSAETGDVSDIQLAMKLHRLGRTSFRAVKTKRDYLQHRKAASWIYMSRLAAVKEYAFLCALHERGFPVPRPAGHSRHVVVMELVNGVQLNQISELANPIAVAADIIAVIARLATHGLVHCDLNEFNVMVGDDEQITVIDFPQMVSTKHPDAKSLYDRDQDGVARFFCHRFGVALEDIEKVPFEIAVEPPSDGFDDRIDISLEASGYGNDDNYVQHIDTGRSAASCVDGSQSVSEGEENIDTSTLDLGQDEEHRTDTNETVQNSKVSQDSEILQNGRARSSDRCLSVVGHSDGESPGMQQPDSRSERVSGSDIRLSHSYDTDINSTGSRIDRSKIADRVRRQRGNQARRRQMSKRNVVKDSEKRKLKTETDRTSFWSEV